MSQAEIERRLGARKPTNDKGLIVAAGEESSCVVLDLAPTGARLWVSNLRLPRTFQLRVHGRRYECVAVWQRDAEIGVTFSESQSQANKTEPPPQIHKIDVRGLRSQLFGRGK